MKIKNSQKVRVIINGVGIFTTAGIIRKGEMFCKMSQLDAVQNVLGMMAEKCCSGLVTESYGHQIQMDLL